MRTVELKEVKRCFRKIEATLSKVTKERVHLAFNEDFLHHQLLPIFTIIILLPSDSICLIYHINHVSRTIEASVVWYSQLYHCNY